METSAAVATTPARGVKVGRLAACLRRLTPVEVPIGVAFLSGRLRQRQIGVGAATLNIAPPPSPEATLEFSAVDAAFAVVGGQSGRESVSERRRLLMALFAQATAAEQDFLRRLLAGALRQGALEGVMLEAVAEAAGVSTLAIRRAYLLAGDVTAVATVALAEGLEGLAAFRLLVGRPVRPMLAESAPSLAAAMARTGPSALEAKLDGVRIQVHRQGEDVRVFTRSLDHITTRLPDIVEAVRSVPVVTAVLDGEALDAPYAAGRRGAGWIKVKPRHTLDLVVLAAEWGNGRRKGWLSNLHLAARDPASGEFVMLGKTFKGLTDVLLTWQTERLLQLERSRDALTVYVRPELVVEVAFDGVQRSSRYPGGVTLRFARVLRYRPDKRPEEADTIDIVRELGGWTTPRASPKQGTPPSTMSTHGTMAASRE